MRDFRERGEEGNREREIEEEEEAMMEKNHVTRRKHK